MGFVDDLRKKIVINRLTDQVLRSWGTAEQPQRIDKEAMKQLLEFSDLVHHQERDLDLYIKRQDHGPPLVLVLDNELKLYRSEIADVVMRKSPTVKEMVRIRNAIKILHDKDVTVWRKHDTVNWLKDELFKTLNLVYAREDLEQLAGRGSSAMADQDGDAVVDTLTLFAELLDYSEAPRVFAVIDCCIWGRREKANNGHILFGPMIIYQQEKNRLLSIRRRANSKFTDDIQRIADIAAGRKPADQEGQGVWQSLIAEVLERV